MHKQGPQHRVLIVVMLRLLAVVSLFAVESPGHADSPGRPYAVLVNGNDDCCVWAIQGDRILGMTAVIRHLADLNAEMRMVPWNHFGDRERQTGRPLNDAAFLREAAEFLNRLDARRPLILIGHSFGGDSLVKLVPRLRRSVEVLAVLDPTAAWGLRAPVVARTIPAHVQIFFNRWQSNLWAYYNTFPRDNRTQPGTFPHCLAKICDDVEQNICRRADDSPISEKCELYEVTCTGWPSGTKQKRLIHTDVPLDARIQYQLNERITQALQPLRSP